MELATGAAAFFGLKKVKKALEPKPVVTPVVNTPPETVREDVSSSRVKTRRRLRRQVNRRNSIITDNDLIGSNSDNLKLLTGV